MALDVRFASADQMVARSQGAIPANHPYLDDALTAATEVIRSYCGWHISGQVTETVLLDDMAGPIMALPSLRVVSVTSLKVNGVDADVASFMWLRDGRLAKPYYVPTYRVAELTLTHGHETTPQEIVDLTLQMAARALASPLGLTREQAGAVNASPTAVAPGAAGGVVLLEHEKASLARFRVGWMP